MFKKLLQLKSLGTLSLALSMGILGYDTLAQTRPIKNVPVIVGIEQNVLTQFGGLESAKTKVRAQITEVNARFNTGSFAQDYNMRVDSFYVYDQSVADIRLLPPAGYHVRLVYDSRVSYAGWWGSIYRTIQIGWSQDPTNLFGQGATEALTHEFGHVQGGWDLYSINIETSENPVNGTKYSGVSSMMNYCYGETKWDNQTIGIANKLGSKMTYSNEEFSQYIKYPSIGVKALDQNGQPLSNVAVKFYPKKKYGGNPVETTPLYNVTTNTSGVYNFTVNPYVLTDTMSWGVLYGNFLIEAKIGAETQYAWMPANSVQANYFADSTKPYIVTFKFGAGAGQNPGCADPQYIAGTAYTNTSTVKNNGKKYQCNVAGWCSSASAWAYEPGVGSAWTQAWTEIGLCSGATPVTNSKPYAFISSPVLDQNLAYTSTLNVIPEARDSDGSISKIELIENGSVVASSTTAPFTLAYTPGTAGRKTLSIVAYDDKNVASDPAMVSFNLIANNTAPVVTITSPTSTAKYLIGGSVTVSATAVDAENDAITKVEIYSPQLGTGSTVTLTTAPYTTTYSQLPAANPQQGGLTFVVKAYDARGTVGYENIFVSQDKLPAVSISSPSNNGTVSVGSVTIVADASDAEGVARVDFLNQVGAVIGTDNTAPYQYTTSLAAGNYTYRAIAYDNAGQNSTTANVSFTVAAQNQAPTAAMTAPANNSIVQAGYALTLTATANDIDGTVSKVEFYSNSGGKLGEATTAPYQITLPAATQGNFLYFAKAIDNNGLEGYSTSVAVTVNAAPTATFSSPVANDKYAQTGTMQINVNPSDVDGTITKVEFFLGNLSTKVGEKTAAPYNLAVSSVPLPTTGQNILPVIVKVTDNNGGITVANTFVQSVVNTIPTATIASPVNNSSSTATAVTISVTATDAEVNTPVTKVEFLNNAGTVVYTKTAAPFNYALTGLAAGTYTYKARSYDALNAVSSVATVTFTVTGSTCTAAAWNSTTAYSTNAIVSYNGIKYKANYWSQGATPDTHSAAYQEWTNQGTCNSRLEEAATSTLSVYPNPATDVLNIGVAAEEVISAEIRNLNGELILSENKTAEINVSSLASGLYTISIRTADNNTVQKFVKQ